MTAYTEIELRCDGASGPYDCEPAIYDNTVKAAREEARRQGWICRGGKDFCPDHQGGQR